MRGVSQKKTTPEREDYYHEPYTLLSDVQTAQEKEKIKTTELLFMWILSSAKRHICSQVYLDILTA